MALAALLLTLVGTFTAIKLYGLNNESGRLKFLGLTIAASLFVIMQLSITINAIIDSTGFASLTGFVVEWGHVACLAFILSSLAVFIRESKPVFAQFPLLYTTLPLLIIVSYILVKDTYALKTWLIAIYQGGGILVALLMYSVYTYHRKEYSVILLGIILFILTYISFWYVPVVQESYSWIWKVLLALSMITTIIGYERAELNQSYNF